MRITIHGTTYTVTSEFELMALLWSLRMQEAA